ncbi:MAG: hypothetical protein E7539_01470 [Ruminococcaceae bacterium]|nr:hypothetical protein [Oscillospiraceae bacterium]
MKKILSAVLAMSLVFAVLAGTSLTAFAEESSQVLSEVVFDAVLPEAEAGKAIADVELSVDDEAEYTAEAQWLDDFGDVATGNFEDGNIYYLAVVLTAKEGYEFSEDGVDVYVGDDYYYAEPLSETEIVFEVRSSLLEKIDVVEITGVTDAEVGKNATVDGIKVPDDAEYSIDYATWYDQNYEEVTGKFEDKNSYDLDIAILPNAGFEFSDEVVVIVNGEMTLDYFSDYDFVNVTLTYSFYEAIDEIALPAFPELKVGDDAKFSEEPVLETDEYTAFGGVFAIDEEGNPEAFEGVIEDGNAYIYYYVVAANEGYRISDETVFKAGGKEANSSYNISLGNMSMIGKMYNFSDIEEITKVELTVTEPKVGATIDPEDFSVPEDAGYAVEMLSWGVSADGNIENSEEAIGEFEEGKHYYIAAILSANEGYIFADNVEISVNGQAYNSDLLKEFEMDATVVNAKMLIVAHSFGELTEDVVDPNPTPTPDPKPNPNPNPDTKPDTDGSNGSSSDDSGNAGNNKAPQTGENAGLAMWVALMLVSCGAVVASVLGKKKVK